MPNIIEKLKFIFQGGVSAPHWKHTAECATVEMPTSNKVVIPMQQHTGAPCTPTVKVGDLVKVGQVIGDSDEFISAPIHASVSGKVTAVAPLLMPYGKKVTAVTIEADGQQTLHESIEPPKIKTIEDLRAAIRASGLVGLGGAGFPTHVKLTPPKEHKLDTLIINAAECEPYITSDYLECIENSENIIFAIKTVAKLMKINNVIIAIEDNKPLAVKELSSLAKDASLGSKINIIVKVLPSRYPQGAEKVLINSVTGRKVPEGKLPSHVGVVVMNISTIGFIGSYLKTGIPLISKRITVDGSAIEKPQNLRAPIGTLIADIISFCGGYKGTPAKLLMGGPMMGTALMGDDMPLIKQNNAILAMDEKEAKMYEETNCISCSRCIFVCPMKLMPTVIEQAVIRGDTQELKDLAVNTCMECGCCSYVCPARRRLVQSMKLGKQLLKKEGEKNNGK